MKQQCFVCQKVYNYCNSCAIVKDPFKNAGYCDEDCCNISLILQRYSGNNSTAEEAMSELLAHNIKNKTLQSRFQPLYDKVLAEVVQKEEVIPQEDVEVVINEDEDMTIS